ncbi:MAG TPA: hypothetical protein VG737_00430, partial [Cyclobacteriaceae bacterium]|nr:hypothetical protein [Cyclobacteriaceae bacterium]
MRSLLCVIVILCANSELVAQCKEWNWPPDKAKAQEQLALLQDAVRAKQYRAAVKPLSWLLKTAPTLNVSIYIRGAEVFEGRVVAEKDSTKRAILLDSLLLLYDLRSNFCDDKANVASRKAMAAFKHMINGSQPERVLPLMDEALKLNGGTMMDAMLLPYMETLAVMHLKKKMLTEDEILNRYDRLMAIVDEKMKMAKGDKAKTEKLNGYRAEIDNLLLKV